jgi:hypothetical protein
MITGGLDQRVDSVDTLLGLLFMGELVPLSGIVDRTAGFTGFFEDVGCPTLGLLLGAGE